MTWNFRLQESDKEGVKPGGFLKRGRWVYVGAAYQQMADGLQEQNTWKTTCRGYWKTQGMFFWQCS